MTEPVKKKRKLWPWFAGVVMVVFVALWGLGKASESSKPVSATVAATSTTASTTSARPTTTSRPATSRTTSTSTTSLAPSTATAAAVTSAELSADAKTAIAVDYLHGKGLTQDAKELEIMMDAACLTLKSGTDYTDVGLQAMGSPYYLTAAQAGYLVGTAVSWKCPDQKYKVPDGN